MQLDRWCGERANARLRRYRIGAGALLAAAFAAGVALGSGRATS